MFNYLHSRTDSFDDLSGLIASMDEKKQMLLNEFDSFVEGMTDFQKNPSKILTDFSSFYKGNSFAGKTWSFEINKKGFLPLVRELPIFQGVHLTANERSFTAYSLEKNYLLFHFDIEYKTFSNRLGFKRPAPKLENSLCKADREWLEFWIRKLPEIKEANILHLNKWAKSLGDKLEHLPLSVYLSSKQRAIFVSKVQSKIDTYKENREYLYNQDVAMKLERDRAYDNYHEKVEAIINYLTKLGYREID